MGMVWYMSVGPKDGQGIAGKGIPPILPSAGIYNIKDTQACCLGSASGRCNRSHMRDGCSPALVAAGHPQQQAQTHQSQTRGILTPCTVVNLVGVLTHVCGALSSELWS